jgi:hypothetical protein
MPNDIDILVSHFCNTEIAKKRTTQAFKSKFGDNKALKLSIPTQIAVRGVVGRHF